MSGSYIAYPNNSAASLVGSISLTTEVNGILPVANGGTNRSTLGITVESSSAVLILNGWNGATINSTTIQVKKASSIQDGYLSATDFALFSSTASGSGSNISVGTLDGANKSVAGAVIGSSSLFMQSAGAIFPGLVSSAAQTFAGVKTFSSAPAVSSLNAAAPLRTDSSGNLISGSISLSAEVVGNLPLSQTSGSISLTAQVSGNLPLSQTQGSLSLSTQVNSKLPISQTTGSVDLTNQVVNNLPLSQTQGSLSLANQVASNLPVANLNGGVSANNTTFWRGDGAWATPGGLINPMTTFGDIIVGSTGGLATRLGIGSTSYALLSNPNNDNGLGYQNIDGPSSIRNVQISLQNCPGGALRIAFTQSTGSNIDAGFTAGSPGVIAFRSLSTNDPRYYTRFITGTCSMTLSPGSNLGVVGTSISAKYWVYAFDNSNTPGIAVASVKLDDTQLQNMCNESATAICSGNAGVAATWTTQTINMVNNMGVCLSTAGNLPQGFAQQTMYWTVSTGTTTFQLSLVPGGSAITTTGSGNAGVHTFHAQHTSLVTSSNSGTVPVRLIGVIVPLYNTVVGSATLYSTVQTGGVASVRDDVSIKYVGIGSGSVALGSSPQRTVYNGRNYDSHAAYSPDGAYVVPIAGKYQVNASALGGATFVAGQDMTVQINRNGSKYSQFFDTSGGSEANIQTLLSDIVQCDVFDIITIAASCSGTGPSYTQSSFSNFVSITKVWP